MQYKNSISGATMIAAALSLSLAGCGGTKVLKEPEPLVVTQSLANTSDQTLAATLDWVIVRGGPGTWAKNADWDEYLIRVENTGHQTVRVTNAMVLDSLGTRIGSSDNRKQLIRGAKDAKRRYKGEGLEVRAGAGAGTMMVAGAVTAAAAVSIGSAALFTSQALAGAALGGLVLAPALAVGGVFRGVNNSKVGKQIEARQAPFPVELQSGEEKLLNVFFPLTPSPQQLELTYVDSLGEHIVIVDTLASLEGLHLEKVAE